MTYLSLIHKQVLASTQSPGVFCKAGLVAEGALQSVLSSEGCSLADSNFVLGNAQVAGLFPVVYCSDGFCDLTGFSRAEVMQRGCACSFLYGPDTSELVRQQIRKALDEHKEFKAELILYRKSGEAPWYQFATLVGWAPTPFMATLPFPSSHVPIHSSIPFSALPLSCPLPPQLSPLL